MREGWIAFFQALAPVAATVFAIVFAVLQIERREWRESRHRTVQALAALTELFVPVLIALIALMADNPWRIGCYLGAAAGLVILGVQVLVYALAAEVPARRDTVHAVTAGLSAFVYLGILIAGRVGSDESLYWAAGFCVWLIFSGASEAALLLGATVRDERPST